MKAAFVTGVTGQDGSYMVEQLLENTDYKAVYGMVRRNSHSNLNEGRLSDVIDNPRFYIRYGDVTDFSCICEIIDEIWTMYGDDIDCLEIYNLAAMSHVGASFKIPVYTAEVNAMGVLNILEAIRKLGHMDKTRFYQASTSELFGKVQEIPQKETTPFHPRSPYGVAKLYAYWITKNYRESYGLFACNGILFNHCSSRRGDDFVTMKIAKGVKAIKKSISNGLSLPVLQLGNLESKRDWGYAPEYVKGMRMILGHDEPDDFILATGETHSVREFVEAAFEVVNLPIIWSGSGLEEKGLISSGDVVVEINEQFFRPAEVDLLVGDATKARNVLGWSPEISFKKLVEEMLDEY